METFLQRSNQFFSSAGQKAEDVTSDTENMTKVKKGKGGYAHEQFER